jgi:hypothetical protein
VVIGRAAHIGPDLPLLTPSERLLCLQIMERLAGEP